jgi:hypothetical protein
MKTDTFRTTFYYVETMDRFQVFDYRERPGEGSWVLVQQDDRLSGLIERFHGQSFIAVVRWVEFYPLKNSEQHTPPKPGESKPEPIQKMPAKQRKPRNPFPKSLAC